MSLLIFGVSPTDAMVITDTLATDPTGEPHLLVSKAGIVPHLGVVIAGTGVAQLADRWRIIVFGELLCRDIEMLDLHAPAGLRRIWGALRREFPEVEGVSATVYHFGFSAEIDQYVGYAYRSTSNFESEMLPQAYGIKPEPVEPLDGAPSTLEGWIELAERLRAEQEALPLRDRIQIGGELILTSLRNGMIGVQTIYRFADFEEQWLEMNRRLQA